MAGLRKKSTDKEELVEEVQAEEVEAIAPLEVKAPVEVAVQEEQKAEPQVRVKLNSDLRTYIGDQWFNFKAGQITNVPKQVKDILARAGYLDVL